MPLWLLGVLVVVGLTSVIASTWVRGGLTDAPLDEATVRATVLSELKVDPDQICLADDGLTALFTAKRVGVVARMGRHLVVREHVKGAAETAEGLRIVVGEWSVPDLRVALADPTARATWMERLHA